ncbi:hypothetical protein D9756_008177 [Leucocoprinus leucothites]|uniref:Uncharacterized protein n=1 Tax=Leucocoprinus leucothites TaxID=201217 RepID=A0A8H5FW78_9AGAR|nr:hypothetical protein D9756_008177 [Leucoagaricus leucothites]
MLHSGSFAGASNFQMNNCYFHQSSGSNTNLYYFFRCECHCPRYPWTWAVPSNFVVDEIYWHWGIPPHHFTQPRLWSSQIEQEGLTFGPRSLVQPYTFLGPTGSWPHALQSIPLYSVNNGIPHLQPPTVLEPDYSSWHTQRQAPGGVYTLTPPFDLEQTHSIPHPAPLLSLDYVRNNDSHAHCALRDGHNYLQQIPLSMLPGVDYGRIPGQPHCDDLYSAPTGGEAAYVYPSQTVHGK